MTERMSSIFRFLFFVFFVLVCANCVEDKKCNSLNPSNSWEEHGFIYLVSWDVDLDDPLEIKRKIESLAPLKFDALECSENHLKIRMPADGFVLAIDRCDYRFESGYIRAVCELNRKNVSIALLGYCKGGAPFLDVNCGEVDFYAFYSGMKGNVVEFDLIPANELSVDAAKHFSSNFSEEMTLYYSTFDPFETELPYPGVRYFLVEDMLRYKFHSPFDYRKAFEVDENVDYDYDPWFSLPSNRRFFAEGCYSFIKAYASENESAKTILSISEDDFFFELKRNERQVKRLSSLGYMVVAGNVAGRLETVVLVDYFSFASNYVGSSSLWKNVESVAVYCGMRDGSLMFEVMSKQEYRATKDDSRQEKSFYIDGLYEKFEVK